MKFVLILLVLFFLSASAFALPLIKDGSFEENCISPTSCVYSVSISSGISFNAVGDDWNHFRTPGTESGFGTREFQIIKNIGSPATAGDYYGRLFSQGSTSGTASQDLKSLQLLRGGILYVDFNSISIGGSPSMGFQIIYDYLDPTLGSSGSTTLLTITSNGGAAPYIGNDINIFLPTEYGYLKFRAGAGFAQSVDAKFDNIRYERHPLIELDTNAFKEHLTENEGFAIIVDYNAGASCTVTETISGNDYSASYIGGEKYQTGTISFGFDDANVLSEPRYFSVDCDGIEEQDPRWRVLINKHDIISDGSVEENCTAATKCTSSIDGGAFVNVGDDWNHSGECSTCTGSRLFEFIRDQAGTKTADGQYYGRLFSGTSTNGTSLQNVTNTQLLQGGRIYIDFNSISFSGEPVATGFEILYDTAALGAVTILSINTNGAAVPYIGLDKNFYLGTENGYLRFRTGAGFPESTNILFDNIRYERLPRIDLNVAFNTHITKDEKFFIQVDYSAGASCTVTETTSGTTYPATYMGNEKYRTDLISYSISDPNASRIEKRFAANCNGLTNSDSRWRIVVNRNEIVADGSLEENCSSLMSCSSSLNGGEFAVIGDDWNQSTTECGACTGLRKFDMIYNSSGTTTDGLYYGKIRSGPSTNGTSYQNIKNLRAMSGGKIYLDINSITLAGTGTNSIFQIIFDYADGFGSSTLLSLNASSSLTPYIGKDISFDIPNTSGHLRIRTGATFTGNVEIIFDNLRYYNPKFSENTLCRQFQYNGITDDKIDLVFIGSGFDDPTQFKSAIDFVADYAGNENGLFSFEPFKTYKQKFNIWYVDDYKQYQMTKADVNSPFKFGTDVLADAKKECSFGEEFALIAIKPRFGAYAPYFFANGIASPIPQHMAYVGLGCETLGTCSNPTDVIYDFNVLNPLDENCSEEKPECMMDSTTLTEKQIVLPHEFGHSFGGLYDEYQNTTSTSTPSTGTIANCDHTLTCSKWSPPAFGTGCFDVCGYPNWHRPYEHSIMGGGFHAPDGFKTVSENRLKDKILNYPLNQAIDNFNMFLINLNSNSQGNLSAPAITFIQSGAPSNDIDTNYPYSAKLLSSDNQVLYDFNFIIPNGNLFEKHGQFDINGNLEVDINGDPVLTDNDPIELLSDLNAFITFPYETGGTKLNIYDTNNSLLLSINLNPYIYKTNIILGGGGADITSANYKMKYTIQNRIGGTIEGSNYIVQINGDIYNG